MSTIATLRKKYKEIERVCMRTVAGQSLLTKVDVGRSCVVKYLTGIVDPNTVCQPLVVKDDSTTFFGIEELHL